MVTDRKMPPESAPLGHIAMTAVEKITSSEPRYIATNPDKLGVAYFGCITKEGRSSFKVETEKLFGGQKIGPETDEAQMRVAMELIAREMMEMRKVLLWKCLGHLVTGDIGKDPAVTKFVAETVHMPQKPELVTPDDFHQMNCLRNGLN